jgi:hypothetical protein
MITFREHSPNSTEKSIVSTVERFSAIFHSDTCEVYENRNVRVWSSGQVYNSLIGSVLKMANATYIDLNVGGSRLHQIYYLVHRHRDLFGLCSRLKIVLDGEKDGEVRSTHLEHRLFEWIRLC